MGDVEIKTDYGYLNEEMCKKCQGRCCKFLPGAYFPEDFGITNSKEFLEIVHGLIKKGKYAIDWWEGYEDYKHGYFIRPATKGKEGIIFDPAWGGGEPCVFLTDNGCSLKLEDRPTGCRMLEPKSEENGKCICHSGSKKGAADAWWKYYLCFEEVREEINNE